MSLEAFGDDGLMPGEITAEDLYAAGWESDADGILWWKHKDETMSFEDACESMDADREEEE